MIKYRVAFFAAKFNDGHKIDNVIDIWTLIANLPRVIWQTKFNFKEVMKFVKLNFAHVEIWTPREGHLHPRPCDWKNGTMWTSTMRDDWDGTVQRPVNHVMSDRTRWWYWELQAKSGALDAALEYAEFEVALNEGYAKRDIAKFLPVVRWFVKNDNTRNVCSEISYRFMAFARFFKKFKLVSPRLMAWEIYRKTGTLPVQVREFRK